MAESWKDLDRLVSAGRQLVDGVSGARPAPVAATGAKAAGSLAWVVGWKTSSIGSLKTRTTGESPGRRLALNRAPRTGRAAAWMPSLAVAPRRPRPSQAKKGSRKQGSQKNGPKMMLLPCPAGSGSRQGHPKPNPSPHLNPNLSSRAAPCPAPADDELGAEGPLRRAG